MPPSKVLLITSRALTAEQLDLEKGVSRYHYDDTDYVKYWYDTATPEMQEFISGKEMKVLTYNQAISLIIAMPPEGAKTLENIEVVVFDECHCLFSDHFMSNIEVLKHWMRTTLYDHHKYVIGLTATPELIEYGAATRHFVINYLTEGKNIRYKADRLICIKHKWLPDLMHSGRLNGKSLIMCRSIKMCQELQTKIPNSAILVGKSQKIYNSEMDRIRKHIVEHRTFPDTTFIKDPETNITREQPLDVLICTSTCREGFSLDKVSGVRNIISYFVDEMSITQFAGRCRYDIDYLVIVDALRWHKHDQKPYEALYIDKFKEYVTGTSMDWRGSIAHIIRTPACDDINMLVKTTLQPRGTAGFMTWLADSGYIAKDLKDKKARIRSGEDWDRILAAAKQFEVLRKQNSRCTFAAVEKFLKTVPGCQVVSRDSRDKNGHYAYKLIFYKPQEVTND